MPTELRATTSRLALSECECKMSKPLARSARFLALAIVADASWANPAGLGRLSSGRRKPSRGLDVNGTRGRPAEPHCPAKLPAAGAARLIVKPSFARRRAVSKIRCSAPQAWRVLLTTSTRILAPMPTPAHLEVTWLSRQVPPLAIKSLQSGRQRHKARP